MAAHGILARYAEVLGRRGQGRNHRYTTNSTSRPFIAPVSSGDPREAFHAGSSGLIGL